MRILVVSDSHGNRELLSLALSRAKETGTLDLVIHLGDEHTDLQGLLSAEEKATVAPGIYHDDYRTGAVSPSRTLELNGIVVAMAHQPPDLPSLQGRPEPRLLLHGHTHNLLLSQDPWGLRFNPGHLVSPTDKGRPASFGLLEIAQDTLSIQAFGLAKDPLFRSLWPFDSLRRPEGF